MDASFLHFARYQSLSASLRRLSVISGALRQASIISILLEISELPAYLSNWI